MKAGICDDVVQDAEAVLHDESVTTNNQTVKHVQTAASVAYWRP